MSNIRDKSDENIEAAQLLINNGKYTSSVHCSYYGCFQMMKHVLATKCNVEYDVQNSTNGQDSHLFIRDKILNEINDHTSKRNIRSYFDNIKADRRRADYLQDKISDMESLETLDQSKKLIRLLKQQFVI